MQIPIKIKITTKCKRCGLLYPEKESVCSHCAHLTDGQVQDLKDRYEGEKAGNANLGRLFLYIAVLFLIGTLIVVLSGK